MGTLVPELSSGFLNVIYRGHIITDWLTCLDMFEHVWTCLNKSPAVFCGHIRKTCNRKKIKISSIRKSFFFQLYNNFTISIACDKIEAKKAKNLHIITKIHTTIFFYQIL